MQQDLILSGIKVDELLLKIENLIEQKLELASHKEKEVKNSKLLSRKEVAELLKISLPTLNEWSKLGWLQSYKMGKRVFYKPEEIEKALHKVMNLKHKKFTL